MTRPDDEPTTGFETRAIHAGQEPDPATGAVVVPIYQTSTFAQDGVGGLRGGYEYSRSANPTRTALETCLAALEGGTVGLAFASGLAAEDTLLRTCCRPGDHVVIPHDAYGGTYRLVRQGARALGRAPGPSVDLATSTRCAAACADGDRGRVVRDADQPAARHRRHRRRGRRSPTAPARCSWSTTPSPRPYLQQPLALGADVVVHSTTKYLGGHSDVVGGALVVGRRRARRAAPLPPERHGRGAGPFDSWLVLRGVKTLAVRMDRHCDNAAAVVELLADHPAVGRGLYPGLADSPGPRGRGPPDARLRRHGLLPAAGGEAAALRRVRARPGCSPWPSRSAGSSP